MKTAYEILKENRLAYLRDFSLIDYKDEKKIPIEISLSTVQNENFKVGSRQQGEQNNQQIAFHRAKQFHTRTPFIRLYRCIVPQNI